MSNEMIIACLPFLWPSASARTVGRQLQAFMHPPAMRLRAQRAMVERKSRPQVFSFDFLRHKSFNWHIARPKSDLAFHHLPVS
ncbi:hypothetical protein [Rhizobium bangladeshense]|uniref:hypothetical protein n=1 Tax=Rhizobium bangladeshense TaxID=1138189 RepID=UPI001A97D81C|nr:hypothetical protein [Rhizobium bangladeshense]MBX4933585.1 hypothetical protein [Rhizobium bangladeshense]MBY3583705.1 hypothetical protein [Rhizobium bangladeshense]QSY88179.1 hypothetical protein J2J98_18765 [Rhizobium bangladeshense]